MVAPTGHRRGGCRDKRLSLPWKRKSAAGNCTFPVDVTFDGAKAGDPDALPLPGGYEFRQAPDDPKAVAFVKSFFVDISFIESVYAISIRYEQSMKKSLAEI